MSGTEIVLFYFIYIQPLLTFFTQMISGNTGE